MEASNFQKCDLNSITNDIGLCSDTNVKTLDFMWIFAVHTYMIHVHMIGFQLDMHMNQILTDEMC